MENGNESNAQGGLLQESCLRACRSLAARCFDPEPRSTPGRMASRSARVRKSDILLLSMSTVLERRSLCSDWVDRRETG